MLIQLDDRYFQVASEYLDMFVCIGSSLVPAFIFHQDATWVELSEFDYECEVECAESAYMNDYFNSFF